MPFDAAVAENDTTTKREKDVGEMAWGEILRSPHIPNNFKDLIMLQLDAAGQLPGLIKRARFGLSLDEEIEQKREEREKALGQLLFFQQQRADFVALLQQQKYMVGKELDNVNGLINKLRGKKGQDGLIEDLTDYRNDLRTHEKSLSKMAREAAVVGTIKGLGTLMRTFGRVSETIYNRRAEILGAMAVAGRVVGGVAQLAGQGLGQIGRLAFSFV
ncbi:MAG: hypothetical protein ACRBCT_01985 [Alphaproteobacteria bacterium]